MIPPETHTQKNELGISDQELELLKAIRTKSAIFNVQDIFPSIDSHSKSTNEDLPSPKRKIHQALNKIFGGISKTLSINKKESEENPVFDEKKNFLRSKSIFMQEAIENKKTPEGCEGLPELLVSEKRSAAQNILNLLKMREKYLYKDHSNYVGCQNIIKKIPGSTEPIIDYSQEIPLLNALAKADLIQNEEGVYEAVINGEKLGGKVPTSVEFFEDLSHLVEQVYNSINKSLSHKRVHILDEKFKMHNLYYSEKEQFETQQTAHRDFYNCRKVDTHIHFAACMRAKQLLRFMVEKIEKDGDSPVLFNKKENKWLTLNEICKMIGVNSKDINLDSLNVQADSSIFHRFDRFNEKYNPLGAADLRTIFLKTDNDIQGSYLAELTHMIMQEMEDEKYCFAEWRVSIYGKSCNEWSKLAQWFKEHKIFSHQVRWMIQIPRLYSVYRKNNIVKNFQEMIDNIFKPIFEVTLDPAKDPNLYQLLFQIVGFDTVDDESVYEVLQPEHILFSPNQWVKEENPVYAYWSYYIYANLYHLNALRKHRGLNTFTFRPHCGESGNIDHLATGFLVADAINHGIVLEKTPVLQYLYYLEQIGIAVSPLSNNKLFVQYQNNPFPKFFARGLNVSLSTDDPLMIHITKEPLLEEYAVAAQVWNLSTVDLCEIARNSVKMSSFEELLKKHWIGEKYNSKDKDANDPALTNVPHSRFLYRWQTLRDEFEFLNCLSSDSNDFFYNFPLVKY